MNQKTIGFAAAAVVVALGAYWLGSRSGGKVAPPMPGAAMPGVPMPGAVPGLPPGLPPGAPHAGAASPADFETLQRIAIGEQLVQREPKNRQAWVQLGNDYFDTRQPQKSIDAYAKALELGPDDPDVLTDQGVMQLELGKPDRAIANFEKASKLDPKHVKSVFNLGVVFAYHLKDPAKAARYWSRVIEMAPGSPEAVKARQALASAPAP
ncbi:MAG TPA: tetratricopeptide repeat protein [Anaeromyxobacteraceae bacterium]|nr:tetratricopeptide repeat protein [Anaeromyxobacteraceae bacterium]